MSVLATFQSRLAATLNPIYDPGGQLRPRPMYTPADVRLYISEMTQVQQQLRLLKSEVSNESKQVAAQFTHLSAQVKPNVGTAMLFGQRAGQHSAVVRREHIHQQKLATLAPYQQATMQIDQTIQRLEEVKLSMKRQIV